MLDLGCGGGLVAEAIAAEGYAVTGLDASLPSLRAARDHSRSVGYLGGDATRLPFADGAFVCSEVLEHVDDADALLREAVRVLAPGGLLLFSTPNRTWFARVGLIWVAELLRWAPRRTHVYSAFMTPIELALRMQRVGLVMRQHRGIALRRAAVAAMWGYLRRRELGGFRLSHDRRLQYTGWAEVLLG